MSLVSTKSGEPFSTTGYMPCTVDSPTATHLLASYSGAATVIEAQNELARKISDLRIMLTPFLAANHQPYGILNYSLDKFSLAARVSIYTRLPNGNAGVLVTKLGEYGLDYNLLGLKVPDFILQPKQIVVLHIILTKLYTNMVSVKEGDQDSFFDSMGFKQAIAIPVASTAYVGFSAQFRVAMLSRT